MITNQRIFNKIEQDTMLGLSIDSIVGKYANKSFSNTDEIRKTVQYITWNHYKKTGVRLDKLNK